MKHFTLANVAAAAAVILRAVPVQCHEIETDMVAHIAELSAEERDDLENEWSKFRDTFGDGESPVGFRAFCVAYCLCDQSREFLTTDAKTRNDAAAKLQGANAKAIGRMFNTAARINGLTKTDEEELTKNSPTRQSDAGNGESPSVSATPRARRGSKKSVAANTPSSEPSADSNQSDTNA